MCVVGHCRVAGQAGERKKPRGKSEPRTPCAAAIHALVEYSNLELGRRIEKNSVESAVSIDRARSNLGISGEPLRCQWTQDCFIDFGSDSASRRDVSGLLPGSRHHNPASVHRQSSLLLSWIIGSSSFVFRSTARTIVRSSMPSALDATAGMICRESGRLKRTVKVPSGRS